MLYDSGYVGRNRGRIPPSPVQFVQLRTLNTWGIFRVGAPLCVLPASSDSFASESMELAYNKSSRGKKEYDAISNPLWF